MVVGSRKRRSVNEWLGPANLPPLADRTATSLQASLHLMLASAAKWYVTKSLVKGPSKFWIRYGEHRSETEPANAPFGLAAASQVESPKSEPLQSVHVRLQAGYLSLIHI